MISVLLFVELSTCKEKLNSIYLSTRAAHMHVVLLLIGSPAVACCLAAKQRHGKAVGCIGIYGCLSSRNHAPTSARSFNTLSLYLLSLVCFFSFTLFLLSFIFSFVLLSLLFSFFLSFFFLAFLAFLVLSLPFSRNVHTFVLLCCEVSLLVVCVASSCLSLSICMFVSYATLLLHDMSVVCPAYLADKACTLLVVCGCELASVGSDQVPCYAQCRHMHLPICTNLYVCLLLPADQEYTGYLLLAFRQRCMITYDVCWSD